MTHPYARPSHIPNPAPGSGPSHAAPGRGSSSGPTPPAVGGGGLEKFPASFRDRSGLVGFYYLGWAFGNGAASLRLAAATLQKLDEAGRLDPAGHYSAAYLCRLLPKLEAEVFGPYFGDDRVRLFGYAEGFAGAFTPAGWRAWELTRDFLAGYGGLPPT